MSPSHILEPTYRALKERLMQGEWPLGFRLDTARLAASLDVSKSPVRDSLNRLAGERLVDFEPGEGFHVPRLDEKRLRDLLDLNRHLLIAAIDGGVPEPIVGAVVSEDLAVRAATSFSRIAEASDNDELLGAIAGLNDRLSPARRLDSVLLPAPASDLNALDAALLARSGASILRDIIARYHAVRTLHAGAFVHRLVHGSVDRG